MAKESLEITAVCAEHVVLVRGSIVVVHSRATGEELCRIEADGDVACVMTMTAVAVSSTHVAFVIMSDDVAVHALPSGKKAFDIHSGSNAIHFVALSPDGSRLAVVDCTLPLRIFDVVNWVGKLLLKQRCNLRKHVQHVT